MACGIYLKMTTGSQQTRSRQTGSQETEGPMSVGRFANSYHKGQPWTGRYLKELAASPIEYAPFLIWRKQPFEGQLINIDSAGNRVTPGAACREGSYNVFMLGGSTLWGWGSPDWGTIPAYLQKELQPYLDQPLCVVNMAEVGHVYTQELIMLQQQLQLGHVPDLVVVYNGGNEVITTYIHSRADVHYDFELIADIYNHRHDPARQKSFLSDLMTEHSYALQVFARIRRKLSPSGQGTSLIIERSEQNRDQLTTDLRLSYQANSKALQALSREYGFESAVFLQSSIWTAGKKMTDEELTAPLKEVSTMGHMLKSLQTVQVDHFYDFSRVLDDTEKTVYI